MTTRLFDFSRNQPVLVWSEHNDGTAPRPGKYVGSSQGGDLVVELLDEDPLWIGPWERVTIAFSGMQPGISNAISALQKAVPLLELLGDYVANDYGRCEAILAARRALQQLGLKENELAPKKDGAP